jgi:hypothetical protein
MVMRREDRHPLAAGIVLLGIILLSYGYVLVAVLR